MELFKTKLFDLVVLNLSLLLLLNIFKADARIDDDYKKYHEEAQPIAENSKINRTTPKPPQLAPPKPHEPWCYRLPRERCPVGPLRCQSVDEYSVFCCDVTYFTLKEGLTAVGQNVTNLHILNATVDDLDISQSAFRRLWSMSVTDGNIGKISGRFPKLSPLACLNISNNNLTSPKLSDRPLSFLFNLTVLDVSANNLTEFPLKLTVNRNISIDLSGNNFIPCKEFGDAMLNDFITFLNYNKTYCAINFKTDWFSDFQPIPIDRLRLINELNELCKKIEPRRANCTCENQRWEQSRQNAEVTGITAVDCSNRNLNELPWNLPPDTIFLNVSHNQITSLRRVSEDSYDNLKELDADHNLISSIDELEGSKFIDNFVLFRLRANRIKYLHSYVFSNTFEKYWIGRQLFLGENHLHCDCNTEKILKRWMMDKSKNMPDYYDVMCDGGLGRVVELLEYKVCQGHRDWTHYIAYIITAEVLAIVILVSKVSYDYWIFKTAGYLPWPANKMPRLPCDWLCE